MHDAQLHSGLRINRLDGLGKALQTVHASYEDIFQPTIR
jgi:hypothetical protein